MKVTYWEKVNRNIASMRWRVARCRFQLSKVEKCMIHARAEKT
jgi:primosomal protein N''